LENQIETLINENESLTTTNQRLTLANGDLTTTNVELDADLQGYKDGLEATENQLTGASGTIDSLKLDISRLENVERMYHEVDEEKKALESQLKKMEAIIKEAGIQVQDVDLGRAEV